MKTAIIGTGNVATRFAEIFDSECVSSRTLEGLPSDADLYIIAVSDSAVKKVADSLPELPGIVVHTTGSVPLEALGNVRCRGIGVLYPFQTISKKRPLPASSIPLLVEADCEETASWLEIAARESGFTNVTRSDSDMRRKVHLAGVFVSNFPNAMVAIAQKILGYCGIDGAIVNPLLAETVAKLKSLPAKEAQTGPAVRKDFSTIEKHITILDDLSMKEESKVYSVITDFIVNNISTH